MIDVVSAPWEHVIGSSQPEFTFTPRKPTLTLNDCRFNMETGRPLVTGTANATVEFDDPTDSNGDGDFEPDINFHADAPAEVTINNPKIMYRTLPQNGSYGLLGYAFSWNSVNLEVNNGTVHVGGERSFENGQFQDISSVAVPFITTTPLGLPINQGLGFFVHYQALSTAGLIRKPRIGFDPAGVNPNIVPTGNLTSAVDGMTIDALDVN